MPETLIGGQTFTLFKDYDKDKLRALPFEHRISWFESRINHILIRPLELALSPQGRQLLENPNSTFLLCSTMLVCSGIDTLGGFYKGARETSHETFKSFVTQYMHEDFDRKHVGTRKYVDILLDSFRNGLAHDLCVKAGGVEEGAHYFIEQPYGLEINPLKLYEDFRQAFGRYMSDLRKAKPSDQLGTCFQKRFEQVFLT